MRMASTFYRGMFETKLFTLPDKVLYWKDIQTPSNSHVWEKVKEFMSIRDLACSEIVSNNQKYRRNDLVVLEVIEGLEELKVGVVEAIVVKNDSVFLGMRTYVAIKHPFGYYESVRMNVELTFTETKNLADFKPLVKHGTTMKFQFVLHHHISYSQN